MRSLESSRVSLGAVILILLVSPFVILSFNTAQIDLNFGSEVWSVFGFTVLQAAASAAVSVALGVVAGLGLLWASRESGRAPSRDMFRLRWLLHWIEAVALFPNVVPVIILLLSVMKFFPFAKGLFGIVFVHALLNIGLVASVFARIARSRLTELAELAWIEGASGPKFFFAGAWPMLRGSISTLTLFVFAICFSSFSVPLMIGGSQATTIEVLIWQRIQVTSNWPEAIGLSLLQMVAVVLLSLAVRGDAGRVWSSRSRALPLLSWKWGIGVALAPALIMFAGLFGSISSGLQRLASMESLRHEIPRLIAGSFFVSSGVGILSAIFLLGIAYVNPRGGLRKFLLGYVAPSTVLTGFALLIIWRATGVATYFKLVLGLTLVLTPSFYRLQWDAILSSLEGQRTVAWSLGASSGLAFTRVVFPQVIGPACFMSGVAALWAWGDFALSSVIAEKNVTLAMLAQGLMESYRLDAATVLIWVMIIGGGLTFALFAGVGRVLGSKPQS